MDFAGAIKSGFVNFRNFGGRATRPEYWWFVLFNFLVTTVAAVIDGISDTSLLGNVVGFVLFIPMLSLLFRRFRDAGVSPWWLLTWLVPFITTVVLVVLNANSIIGLADGLDGIDFTDDQAVANYFSSSPYFLPLIGAALIALGVWSLYAIFEFIITLLPTKKPQQPAVAEPNYY